MWGKYDLTCGAMQQYFLRRRPDRFLEYLNVTSARAFLYEMSDLSAGTSSKVKRKVFHGNMTFRTIFNSRLIVVSKLPPRVLFSVSYCT